MVNGKQRWKLLLTHKKQNQPQIPPEFLCPISGAIMADPVIVSAGHTFERTCVRACLSLSFHPTLPNGAVADFSTLIPNLALRSAILTWCRQHLIDLPHPIDFDSALKIVRKMIPAAVFTRTPSELSSEESVSNRNLAITPPPSSGRPLCYSSSSSCDLDSPCSNFEEEEEFMAKLRNPQIDDQEESLLALRKLTRNQDHTRVHLCTPRLLSAIRSLILSRYSNLQVNAIAIVVNLSLEKQNKVKIVRSGIVPPLIEVLRGAAAASESQEHAAGALFSLSLDDQNKTAIGVIGALPPLLQSLRSESERTRHDSAMALYHLSLVQSNRVKMVKLGCIQILLDLVKSGRVMLILCNMAISTEGRAAMLDGGAVECLVNFLRDEEFKNSSAASSRESCVAVLYGLSYGGLRFKGLAKEAGAEEVLRKVSVGTRAKEKVEKILDAIKDRDEEDGEDIDWERLLNSEDDLSRTD